MKVAKNDYESLFSFEPLDLEIYNQIITILEYTYKINQSIKNQKIVSDLIEEIGAKKGFMAVLDCIISILLDKSKKLFWFLLINSFLSSEFISSFMVFDNKYRKKKIIALLWYCEELFSDLSSTVRSTISYITRPSDFFNSMEELYIAYPGEELYTDWTRSHPDIVREIQNLKIIYK